MNINQILTSISSFMLPITYTITIIYFVIFCLTKLNVKVPFIKKASTISLETKFILLMTFISIIFFAIGYNKGKINVLISLSVILVSYLITKIAYSKKSVNFANISIISSIILCVILNNMFGHPEAFSIEKSGNFDIAKLILLQLISVISAFVISSNIIYKRFIKKGKVSKFKKHIFLNKTLTVFILNCMILLLFTESIISLQISFVFALIISYLTSKNLDKKYWNEYHSKVNSILLSFIICLSSIFIGNILLSIISSFAFAITYKSSFDENKEFLSEAKEEIIKGYSGI